jgi:hypothetical protein
MKNFAKIMIFFSITFAILFLAAILFGLISFWVNSARIISAEAGLGRDIIDIVWTAISAAIYFSILFTLSYSARKKMPILISIFSTIALALVFTIGVSLGTRRIETLKPAFIPLSPVQAGPGLILTRLENTIILLRESSDTHGPRLVSIPDRPLIYQDIPIGPNNTVLSLPPLPLGDTAPWFIQSVGIDFSLSAGELRTLFERNFLFFAVYALALIMLLSSLRFLLELSLWPLANIFLAAFVFRLILSLEIFINSAEINTMIGSFLAGRLPPTLITPIVFIAISILTMLYTLLAGIARSASRKTKRDRDED